MKIVELFAGIGGFRLGFGEGNEYVFVNDVNKEASSIYEYQFKHKVDSRFIQDVPSNEIPEHDLLCGGFPCATFSIAGKREGLQKITIKVYYFMKSSELPNTKNQSLYCLKMLKDCLLTTTEQPLPKSYLNWKELGTMHNGNVLTANILEHPKTENEYLLLELEKTLDSKIYFRLSERVLQFLKQELTNCTIKK